MTRTTNLILATAAGLALQSAPAIAQTNDTIEVFTRADLHAALDANEATYEANEDGRTIDVTFKNTLRANAAIMACDEGDDEANCYATSILATFGMPEGATPETITEAINTYNYRENFGRAYVSPNGRISVRIYIISDGGIKRENYRRQIELWSTSLEYFVQYLYEGTEGETTS